MYKDIMIPAHGVYYMNQIEFQVNAAEGLLDTVMEPMIHCMTCKGLLEEYSKETNGDLDKAARAWMEENIDTLYAAIRATAQLLNDALDTIDKIPQEEVCNNA